MDLRWIKDTIIRISLPYLGSSIYCSLHFQMQTITNMYDETNFSRSFTALLTHGLWRLLKLLFQKSHHYQVHFIKICTEFRDYSNCYIFYYYYFRIKFCIVITVFAVMKVILDTSEKQIFKDPLTVASFLESINTLRSFCTKSFSTKKAQKNGSWTKAILGMQF